MPLPADPYLVGGGQELGGLEWVAPATMRRGEVRPRRHRLRRIRRVLGTVMALAVLGAVAFTGLLMVTPAVSNAPALNRATGANTTMQKLIERREAKTDAAP